MQNETAGASSFPDSAAASTKGSNASTPTPGRSTRSKTSAFASTSNASTIRTRNGARSVKQSVSSRNNGRATRGSKRNAPAYSDEEGDLKPSISIQTPAKRQRTTRRSRLAEEDGEWQEVPEEWLRPGPSTSLTKATSKSSSSTNSRDGSAIPKNVESKVFGDDESELTELSDDGMDYDAPEPSTSRQKTGEETDAGIPEEVSDDERQQVQHREDDDEEGDDEDAEAAGENPPAWEGPPKVWIEWETASTCHFASGLVVKLVHL